MMCRSLFLSGQRLDSFNFANCEVLVKYLFWTGRKSGCRGRGRFRGRCWIRTEFAIMKCWPEIRLWCKLGVAAISAAGAVSIPRLIRRPTSLPDLLRRRSARAQLAYFELSLLDLLAGSIRVHCLARFIDARYKYPFAAHLDVGLIPSPGAAHRAGIPLPPLLEFRRVMLHHRRIVVCANLMPRSLTMPT